MARYVVLEFQDNADADNFIKAASEDGQGVFVPTEHPKLKGQYSMARPEKDYNVVGVFMRPTLPCTCPSERKTQKGYSRGMKYGLWVHPACGKVNPVALESWGGRLGLGRNLLAENPLCEGLLRLDGTVPPTSIRTGLF